MQETNLQTFVRALYEAHGASVAVDHFDLQSDDHSSVSKWNRLLERQRAAFRALHEVCRHASVEDLMHDE